jgi:hypothetical protein
MPKVEYFLVCRAVQKDMTTDEMSFVNVLEDISPESFPTVIPRAVAVSLWNFQPGEENQDYQAILVVKVPKQPDVTFAVNFMRGGHRCRAIQGALEIPVEGPGNIEFEVKLNGVHEASHTVTIHPVGVREPIVAGETLSTTRKPRGKEGLSQKS